MNPLEEIQKMHCRASQWLAQNNLVDEAIQQALKWNDLEKAEAYLQQGIELCSQAGLDGVFIGLVLKARLRQAGFLE